MPEMQHGVQRSWTHFAYDCFRVCDRQKLENPNLSTMADDAITQAGIGVLGSFYICALHTLLSCMQLCPDFNQDSQHT